MLGLLFWKAKYCTQVGGWQCSVVLCPQQAAGDEKDSALPAARCSCSWQLLCSASLQCEPSMEWGFSLPGPPPPPCPWELVEVVVDELRAQQLSAPMQGR